MGGAAYKGSFSICTDRNLVVAKVSGAWSKYTAEQYVREFKSRVQSFSSQNWWQMVLLEDWILGTPEIEPIIKDLSIWNFAHHLRATAFVSDVNSLKRFQLEKILVDMPDDYQRQFFSNQKDAYDWLEAQGLSRPNL